MCRRFDPAPVHSVALREQIAYPSSPRGGELATRPRPHLSRLTTRLGATSYRPRCLIGRRSSTAPRAQPPNNTRDLQTGVVRVFSTARDRHLRRTRPSSGGRVSRSRPGGFRFAPPSAATKCPARDVPTRRQSNRLLLRFPSQGAGIGRFATPRPPWTWDCPRRCSDPSAFCSYRRRLSDMMMPTSRIALAARFRRRLGFASGHLPRLPSRPPPSCPTGVRHHEAPPQHRSSISW